MRGVLRLISAVLAVLLILPSAGAAGASAESEKLADARKKLTFRTLSDEEISAVTGDLILPVIWEDCFVVWSSGDENLLEITEGGPTLLCRVIRPPFGGGDAVGILTAAIIDGDQFTTKSFAITVLENDIGYTYSTAMRKVRDQFDFEFLGAQNLFALREDLRIPQVAADGVTVTTQTDRPEVLSAAGRITRSAQHDEAACFTVNFRMGNEVLRRSYPVVIKAFDGGEVRQKLLEDLLGAQNYILEKYNISGLTKGLSLPGTGGNGSTLRWKTSDESVITADGKITRGTEARQAVLTVTATLEGLMEAGSLTVTVAAGTSPEEYSGSGGSGQSAMRPAEPVNTAAPAPVGSFVDVPPEHWAFEAIEAMKEKGIVEGTGGGLFEPESPVTREQAVKLLVESMQVEADGPEPPFADVEGGEWYAPFVRAAYNAGIVRGISAVRFGTGQPIIRQDFAVMLCGTLVYCGRVLPEGDGLAFSDAEQIDAYAKGAVQRLSAAGFLSGMPDGSFMPLQTMTRAEAAAVLYRILK